MRPTPEPGITVVVGTAPSVGGGERRERRERRERPDRSYSPSDTHSEPEGGIDTTLAAAFALVRDQLAAAEKEPEFEPEPVAEPVAAVEPEPEPVAAVEPEPVAAVEPEPDKAPDKA